MITVKIDFKNKNYRYDALNTHLFQIENRFLLVSCNLLNFQPCTCVFISILKKRGKESF